MSVFPHVKHGGKTSFTKGVRGLMSDFRNFYECDLSLSSKTETRSTRGTGTTAMMMTRRPTSTVKSATPIPIEPESEASPTSIAVTEGRAAEPTFHLVGDRTFWEAMRDGVRLASETSEHGLRVFDFVTLDPDTKLVPTTPAAIVDDRVFLMSKRIVRELRHRLSMVVRFDDLVPSTVSDDLMEMWVLLAVMKRGSPSFLADQIGTITRDLLAWRRVNRRFSVWFIERFAEFRRVSDHRFVRRDC